jgi:hypothetical protein
MLFAQMQHGGYDLVVFVIETIGFWSKKGKLRWLEIEVTTRLRPAMRSSCCPT